MKHTKEDIKLFSKEVCVTCHRKDSCESMSLKKELCGKFFNWKIGYTNWIIEYCRDSIANPEKYEQLHKQRIQKIKKDLQK